MAKAPTDIRSLARRHTKTAINVLAGIMSEPTAPKAVRIRAAEVLLNRGWGMPTQSLDLGDAAPLFAGFAVVPPTIINGEAKLVNGHASEEGD